MLRRFVAPGLLCCAVPMACAIADDPRTESTETQSPQVIVVQANVEVSHDQDGEDQDADGPKESPSIVVLEKAFSAADDESDVAPLPKLWLGIASKKIDGDLAAFLGSDMGLLVDHVQPGSPAEKAGVKSGDIIWSVDGNEVQDTSDLLKALEVASEEKPLVFKVQRKAEPLEISVTPQPRTDIDSGKGKRPLRIIVNGSDIAGAFANGTLRAKDLRLGLEDGSAGKIFFRLGDPAVISVAPRIELKGDIQIQLIQDDQGEKIEVNISRKAGEPAEIKIKRGDEEKTYTEDNLDELPGDVKDWVKSLLSGKQAAGFFGVEDLVKIGKQVGAMELQELSELAKLLDSDAIKEGKIQAQAIIGEIIKSSKAQAHEAIQQALEQTGVNAQQYKDLARQHAEEARQAARQYADLAKEHAQDAEAKIHDQAEKAKQQVEQQVGQQLVQLSQSAEIAELMKLIEQLRNEIAELRSSTKEE